MPLWLKALLTFIIWLLNGAKPKRSEPPPPSDDPPPGMPAEAFSPEGEVVRGRWKEVWDHDANDGEGGFVRRWVYY